ncbi:hypothetical protein Q9S36_43905 [Microbacterium sp. ARD31]|uniref:hypothetical protein n=1 Tax=Microbacterium sp. ARD31 TaxID=2962576 RepID=UPI002882A22E|nr:hypothetical protein [Microbacterium sp. ARD31]MDT0187151.1 hypothetical protein [Microbacterium sp. ARD31]
MSSFVGVTAALIAAVFALSPGAVGQLVDQTPSARGGSAAEACLGRPPTIVGTPGAEVVGTEGPDVVLSNGSIAVAALGGDDLVCVTGVTSAADVGQMGCPRLDAGAGDDRIDATGGHVPCSLQVIPGPGKDEVLAQRIDHEFGVMVHARERTSRGNEAGADTDVIRTGTGPDEVEAGVQDVVDLAGGDDTLAIANEGGSLGGTWSGGTGSNTLQFSLWTPFRHPNEVHRWRMDNQNGQLMRDGAAVAQMTGFSYFDGHVKGPFRFIGSDVAETVTASGLPPEELLSARNRLWTMILEMRGGDDVFVYLRGGRRSHFDGGLGTDRFSFARGLNATSSARPKDAFLDLATGHLRYTRAGGRPTATSVLNFEDVRWWTDTDVTLLGTDGPNTIASRASKPVGSMTVRGRRGDDVMRGGAGDDVLIGGRGADVVDGRGGSDRCESEEVTRCES